MRGLDFGQTLKLVASPEVSALILERTQKELVQEPIPASVPVTPRMVLDFVMSNSIASSRQALMLFGTQGLQFALTRDHRLSKHGRAKRFSEVNDLSSLYGRSLAHVPVEEAYRDSTLRKQLDIAQLSPACAEAVLAVDDYVKSACWGTDGPGVAPGSNDEECEREIQLEVQHVEEEERQVASAMPIPEPAWIPREVTNATSPADLVARVNQSALGVRRLRDFPLESLRNIDWPANLHATTNFAATVSQGGRPVGFTKTDYWRQLGWVLVFLSASDTHLLLLSEAEAEAILLYLQGLPVMLEEGSTTALVRLCDLRSADLPGPRLVLPVSNSLRVRLHDALLPHRDVACLVAAMLFSGETRYSTSEHREALRRLLPSKKAAWSALEIPCMRGAGSLLERSDLQDVCRDVVRVAADAQLQEVTRCTL
jgi:hypothetical protein